MASHDRIREELEAIQRRSKDGMLHVDEAHDWAQSHPQSALHAALEWDQDRAAREYRLHQIRHLIKLTIVSENGEPEMVSLSIDREAGGGYRRVEDVRSNRALLDVMEADALRELKRVQTRYQHVQRLKGVWREIDKASEAQEARQARRGLAGHGPAARGRARQGRQGEAPRG